MKADSIRIIATTAVVTTAFSLIADIELGLFMGVSVMTFMASVFSNKYKNQK